MLQRSRSKLGYAGIALCLLALLIVPLPARPQAQSVYASGSISGGNPFLTLDIGGQSTCRLEFGTPIGSLPGGATFTVSLISVGSTTTYPTLMYDAVGDPNTSIAGTNVPGAYEIYAQSAGTVQVKGTGMSTAIVPVIINCSGGGPVFQRVTFPSAQPVTCASGCTAGAPVTSVTAVPSCPPGSYPCGLPTPIPTLAPVPAPSASAGGTPPPTFPSWVLALKACQYNGFGNATTQPTPAPNVGNLSLCQSSWDGAELFAPPLINSKVTVAANGTYLASLLNGEASCNLKMNPGASTSAQVAVQNASGITFAGPYTVSGGTNTATFQLATDAYVVADQISILVSSFAGPNNIAITLVCTSASGVEHVYQAGAPWSVTFPSAQPVTPQIASTPFPVSTPAPAPTAPSPAPAGVNPTGYNAAGPAAPIICTHMAGAVISAISATQIVALSAGKSIYVCVIGITVYGSVAGTVTFEYGTGTNCGTGTTALGPGYDFVASATVLTVVTLGTGIGQVLGVVPAGDALCIKSTGTVSAGHVQIMYEQF